MDVRRLPGAVFVFAALCSLGCETTSTDLGPAPVCVGVGGIWDINMVGETGTGIVCPARSLVWTVHQNGCDVAIESEIWDTANGASGGVRDNHLVVEWYRREGCYQYHESIDVLVDGDAMTGRYYLARGQAVYPADCPGLGLCSATLAGIRQAP